MATKTKKPKAEPKAPRPKQQVFSEGVDGKRNAELESAAEEYVAVRNERMEALKREITRGDTLLRKMQELKLSEYEYDGKVITVASLQKVKVKRLPGENGESEGE